MIPEPGFQNPRPYCEPMPMSIYKDPKWQTTDFCCCGSQEIVHLLVEINGTCQILNTTNLSFNQVITVNRGWNSCRVHACRHELQQSHLLLRQRGEQGTVTL